MRGASKPRSPLKQERAGFEPNADQGRHLRGAGSAGAFDHPLLLFLVNVTAGRYPRSSWEDGGISVHFSPVTCCLKNLKHVAPENLLDVTRIPDCSGGHTRTRQTVGAGLGSLLLWHRVPSHTPRTRVRRSLNPVGWKRLRRVWGQLKITEKMPHPSQELRGGGGEGRGGEGQRRGPRGAHNRGSNSRRHNANDSGKPLSSEQERREISLNDEQDHCFCNNFVRTSKVGQKERDHFDPSWRVFRAAFDSSAAKGLLSSRSGCRCGSDRSSVKTAGGVKPSCQPSRASLSTPDRKEKAPRREFAAGGSFAYPPLLLSPGSAEFRVAVIKNVVCHSREACLLHLDSRLTYLPGGTHKSTSCLHVGLMNSLGNGVDRVTLGVLDVGTLVRWFDRFILSFASSCTSVPSRGTVPHQGFSGGSCKRTICQRTDRHCDVEQGNVPAFVAFVYPNCCMNPASTSRRLPLLRKWPSTSNKTHGQTDFFAAKATDHRRSTPKTLAARISTKIPLRLVPGPSRNLHVAASSKKMRRKKVLRARRRSDLMNIPREH